MLPLPSVSLAPGSRLGHYEVIAPLRAGGMATLWLGRRLGPAGFTRHVAIKVVHPHLASDPAFVRMFLDEARLAACIQHSNVVHTEELGEQNGLYYLAMEYVHGCSLSQFLARLIAQKRGLSPELAVHIAMKVADGLHAAHEAKDENRRPLAVVHRDVSPQNVLLSYDGTVKLIDFGVAKARGRDQEETTGASLKGKIRYMSPEQAWGREIDRRTDVYALGIVLWECLTHMRLFGGGDDFAALERVRNPNIQPPSTVAPAISEGLDHAVLTALAADPAARFQTAQAFRRALGGACPRALSVEAEDLATLTVSVMEEEIERERRSAPAPVAAALVVKTPPPSRRTDAMRALTREMAVVPDGAFEAPRQAAPLAAMETGRAETHIQGSPIGLSVVAPMQGPPMQGPPMQGPPMQGPPMQGAPMQGPPASSSGPSAAAFIPQTMHGAMLGPSASGPTIGQPGRAELGHATETTAAPSSRGASRGARWAVALVVLVAFAGVCGVGVWWLSAAWFPPVTEVRASTAPSATSPAEPPAPRAETTPTAVTEVVETTPQPAEVAPSEGEARVPDEAPREVETSGRHRHRDEPASSAPPAEPPRERPSTTDHAEATEPSPERETRPYLNAPTF